MKYNVKICKSVNHDTNYEIEAPSEPEACELAKAIAKKEWQINQDLTGWEYISTSHYVTHLEESAHNEELTDGEVLDLVYEWVEKNIETTGVLELKMLLKNHEYGVAE
jgi:hypothetical protein